MTTTGAAHTRGVLGEVHAERDRQERKWGEQNHPDLMPGTDLGATQQTYADEADAWKATNADRVREANAAGAPSDRNAAWDGILCFASVCTTLTDVEATACLNAEWPTGIESQWRVSPAATFARGGPNPGLCEESPAHRHLLRCPTGRQPVDHGAGDRSLNAAQQWAAGLACLRFAHHPRR